MTTKNYRSPMIVTLIYVALLLGYIFLFIFSLYTAYAMWKGAPFVPTSHTHVQGMMRIADIGPDDTVLDIGSGDGRIVFAAAARARRAIGIEINPLLFWWSRFKAKSQRIGNAHFLRQNLWDADFSSTTVLTLFFIAPKMDALHKKIAREMKPGSRVVSYGFRFPHWQYEKRDDKIYLYVLHPLGRCPAPNDCVPIAASAPAGSV